MSADPHNCLHPTLSPRRGRGKPAISLKARALRYLSAREHSRSELAKKLSRYAGEGDNVEALLNELEAAQFLSNERFAESLVHRRAARFGNSRIFHEMQEHGIDGEVLSSVKATLTQDEVERAIAVWQRKFASPPANATERAKQMRFLQQRGFSHNAIQAAMRAAEKMDRQVD